MVAITGQSGGDEVARLELGGNNETWRWRWGSKVEVGMIGRNV